MSLRRITHELIVVRFQDGVDLPYEDGIAPEIDSRRVGDWSGFLEEFPRSRFRPLYSADPTRLEARHRSALRERPRLPSPLREFAVLVPVGHWIERARRILSRWPGVELAYHSARPRPPLTSSHGMQEYLDRADRGVGADCVRGLPGWDGSHVNFGLVDLGWEWADASKTQLRHDELKHLTPTEVFGDIDPVWAYHGSAVLGIVASADDGAGTIGLAPNPASVRLASPFDAATGEEYSNIPDAVSNAAFAVGSGGILLLELQVPGGVFNPYKLGWFEEWANLPVEIDPAVHARIQEVTTDANGVTVIEAAGNGVHDLDSHVPYLELSMSMSPTYPSYEDSGAVLVGASIWEGSYHRRLRSVDVADASNYGTRVDVFAEGHRITRVDGSSAFARDFDGTSAASAILAGAAVSLQSLAVASSGVAFTPSEMRRILSDASTGTRAKEMVSGVSEGIGVMPNLCAIARAALGIAGDAYVRDHIGDTGGPHEYPLYKSPDIIVRKTQVGNPQTSFGFGSGTENDDALSEDVIENREHYVYVRVRNASTVDVPNLSVKVFWSPPSTLVSPSDWNEIDETVIANVPGGDTLTVTDAIRWPAGAVPSSGDYCFVCLIGDDLDPMPDPTSVSDWASFRQFIRDNNNAAWRNFKVVPPPEETESIDGDEYTALSVDAPGAPDEDVEFELALDARLPAGSRVVLEAPDSWLEAIAWRPRARSAAARRGVSRIALSLPSRGSLFRRVFPRRSRGKLRLLVHIPPDRFRHAHEVALRQLHEGFEVGRFTWRLEPSREKKGETR